MKNSIKKLFVMMAVGMSFVAVQSVSAATVAGTIAEITNEPPTIVVADIEVSGMRLEYLCNQKEICLAVGDAVSVMYNVVECLDDTLINKAYCIG
jgi:hypothetical protein